MKKGSTLVVFKTCFLTKLRNLEWPCPSFIAPTVSRCVATGGYTVWPRSVATWWLHCSGSAWWRHRYPPQ